MRIDRTYIIPIEGLSVGHHDFTYNLERDFFEAIEYADFTADVRVDVELDKQDQLLELTFSVRGIIHTECNRCLREIDLPIDGSYELLIKYGDARDDGEIVFIPEGTREIDIKQYLYEFTGLSIPMQHTCADTEYEQCPEAVRNILNQEPKEDENDIKSKVWDALEDLTFDKED